MVAVLTVGLVKVLFVRVSVDEIVTRLTPPALTVPVPFATRSREMLVSPPLAVRVGVPPVAALASVTSLTAEATVSRMISSFPLASAINPKSANFGAVRVLFESVLVEVSVTVISEVKASVPVVVGNVIVPVFEILEIIGLVRVLLLRVCVPVSVTTPAGISVVKAKVPVDVGRVKVPVLLILEITGLVRVLFVRVSETSLSAVPLTKYALPEARLKFSEDVQASVASTQLRVLVVPPLSDIPPPSAFASVGLVTSLITMFLSSTTKLVVLIFVVVPVIVGSEITGLVRVLFVRVVVESAVTGVLEPFIVIAILYYLASKGVE
jgi:hypothetical protein